MSRFDLTPPLSDQTLRIVNERLVGSGFQIDDLFHVLNEDGVVLDESPTDLESALDVIDDRCAEDGMAPIREHINFGDLVRDVSADRAVLMSVVCRVVFGMRRLIEKEYNERLAARDSLLQSAYDLAGHVADAQTDSDDREQAFVTLLETLDINPADLR